MCECIRILRRIIGIFRHNVRVFFHFNGTVLEYSMVDFRFDSVAVMLLLVCRRGYRATMSYT